MILFELHPLASTLYCRALHILLAGLPQRYPKAHVLHHKLVVKGKRGDATPTVSQVLAKRWDVLAVQEVVPRKDCCPGFTNSHRILAAPGIRCSGGCTLSCVAPGLRCRYQICNRVSVSCKFYDLVPLLEGDMPNFKVLKSIRCKRLSQLQALRLGVGRCSHHCP